MYEMRLKECKVIYYPLSNNCFLLFSYSSMFVHFFTFILLLMRICGQSVHVIVRIRNQSLYIRTAIISVIIYNDQLKPVIIHNDQLKPVIIYNDQQFSLPFHKQTSFLYNSNNWF